MAYHRVYTEGAYSLSNAVGLPTVIEVFLWAYPGSLLPETQDKKRRPTRATHPSHRPTRDKLRRNRRPTRGTHLDAAGLPAAILCTEGLPSLETN